MNQFSSQRRHDLICLCLVLVTLAVYWPVRHYQFVNYDDIYYVYLNPHVRAGLTPGGVAWAFTSHYRSNWHPLTWLSHMLDCEIFGLDAGAQHLVNVAFHAVNVLLLFLVLNRMTRAPWRSAFVAALFALHPLHVESVAWIAERKDVLSAFFFMLTLWAYVGYVERLSVISDQLSGKQISTNHQSPATGFYVLALVFFALGLMSKPMVVTLPFVLLLLDYWPLGRMFCRARMPEGFRAAASAGNPDIRRGLPALQSLNSGSMDFAPKPCGFGRLIVEKLPFFTLSALSCIVTIWAQRGAIGSLEKFPLAARLANAVVAYAAYLVKAVWPTHLAVFYPYHKLPLQVIVLSVVVLIIISAWTLWQARRAPQFIVGWLWYWGTLVPVIGLVQVGQQSMADRYTYLPLIGIFVMLAWAIPDLVFEPGARRTHDTTVAAGFSLRGTDAPMKGAATRNSVLLGALKPVAAVIAVSLLFVLAVLSRLQVRYWENTETLFDHALQVTKDNWIAHYNLGFALAQAGKIPEALQQFEEAVKIKPDYADAQYNLGRALILEGRAPEAVGHWETAAESNPGDLETQNDLARLLATLPPSKGGNPARAVSLAEQTCQHSDYRVAKYVDTLAVAYASADRFNEAVDAGQKALALAQNTRQWKLAGEIEGRLELYRGRGGSTAK